MSDVRAPAVSGRFYPGTPSELERTLGDLMKPLGPIAHPAASRAAIVPHAGYLYSGVTAAHTFARVRIPPIVIIIAPNHTGRARAPGGASLWERGTFETPLGDTLVDETTAQAVLAACSLVSVDHLAHRDEHAVEVEVPFIKFLSPQSRIVPLVLAWDDWESCRALGNGLAEVVRGSREQVLLLASSDLSHYEPANTAEIKDALALDAVQTLDGEQLLDRCHREGITMCGRAPVATVLAAAKSLGASRADIVDYRHSGWVTGDESAVVGYAGVVIT